jgi:uncharacterized membrane protein YedE/YeeE
LILDWAIAGGFVTGAIAGAAARFGRLCTMSAIEDGLVAGDWRGAKAWALALAIAIATTQFGIFAGWIDISRSVYASPQIHVLGAALGGTIFGLGMTLVGTCSFGLLVRGGGGDLRALVTALIVGIFAFAVTAGALAPLRLPLLGVGNFDVAGIGGSSLDRVLVKQFGSVFAAWLVAVFVLLLPVPVLADRRLRKRPRLFAGAILMGLSISVGWFVTTHAVDNLTLGRPESLSFVAPVGRALLQFMFEPLRNVSFGVSAMCGALVASFAMALFKQEFRWEAFDDAKEMRRHLFGGALMGLGGVLAQGCTIGQGLSAASTLALTAPLFLTGVLIGAKIGLLYLIEGTSLWRVGRTPR